MKKKTFIFIITCTLAACSGNKKTAITDSAITQKARPINPVAQKFKPFMDGIWVVSNYVNDIPKTRSPYESSKKFSSISEMKIIIDLYADTIDVGASFGNHEGGNFTVLCQPGSKPTSLKTTYANYPDDKNFYEIAYTIKGKDTTLALYKYDKGHRVGRYTEYTKVANATIPDDGDAAFGIAYITNKTLFSGSYLMTDTAGVQSSVEFTNEGKVLGFPNFKTYTVITDFSVGPENNLDDLIFDWATKTSKEYTFKFDADTLKLFQINSNADSTLQTIGKLKYKLVKQK